MKKAIITGASSGLGYEIAAKLIEKGVKVVNLSRTESDLDIENIKTDLTKNKDIENAIKLIEKKHQDADVLILCAGVFHGHKVGEMLIDEIDNDFAVNITGVIKLTEGLIHLIKKNKGDVVFIGSTSSFYSYDKDSVYVATKHAVLGYVKSLQKEFNNEKIRITGVYPGAFKSQIHIKTEADKLIQAKRLNLIEPSDIAGLIIYSLELPRNIEISEMIIERKRNI